MGRGGEKRFQKYFLRLFASPRLRVKPFLVNLERTVRAAGAAAGGLEGGADFGTRGFVRRRQTARVFRARRLFGREFRLVQSGTISDQGSLRTCTTFSSICCCVARSPRTQAEGGALQVAFGHGDGLGSFRGLFAHEDRNDGFGRSNPSTSFTVFDRFARCGSGGSSGTAATPAPSPAVRNCNGTTRSGRRRHELHANDRRYRKAAFPSH
jgi:hypothetical protein